MMLCGVLTGCAITTKVSTTSPQSPAPVVVHVNKNGMPIPPYAYKPLEIDIIPFVSGHNVTNAFGYDGKMLIGARQSRWLPLSLVLEAIQSAGMHGHLTHETLAVSVPGAIGVSASRALSDVFHSAHDVVVSINGRVTSILPSVTVAKTGEQYVPGSDLIAALHPIHIHLFWAMSGPPFESSILYIGSPIYGLVTAVTEFLGGHGFSTQSGMTLVHAGDNFIPADYWGNVLDNAGYGIQVNVISGFSGLSISVPRSIRVDMRHLPAHGHTPNGEVPIEINGHIVAYAPSLTPTFGGSTQYLASAPVMGAIRRIEIPMHWNKTNGTFTQWYIR